MSLNEDFFLALIGQGGVGKSSLCGVFLKDRFSLSYNPTEEEFYRQTIKIQNKIVNLFISDVKASGDSLSDSILKSQGLMFVYDISNKESYEEVCKLYRKILENKSCEYITKILVGNKCDLVHNREVSFDTGMRTAAEWGCKFIEVSAKNNDKVILAFTECAFAFIKSIEGNTETRSSFCERSCCIL